MNSRPAPATCSWIATSLINFNSSKTTRRSRAIDFFTNFTIPNRTNVERLLRLKKLKNLTVSIYGHDLASFIAITKSTEKVYNRLISNLKTLLEHLDRKHFNLDIGIRTTKMHPAVRSAT